MFEDILGPIDYEKQNLRNKLAAVFKAHYKLKTLRIELIIYNLNIVIKGCFQTGGPEIKEFAIEYLLPLFKATGKTIIFLKHIDYDSGYFSAGEIQWN